MGVLDKIKTSHSELSPSLTIARTAIAVALGLVGSLGLAMLIFTTYKSAFTISVLFSINYDHHLPLKASRIENLGFVTDPVLNDGGIYHDGGGGASQNGYHVIIYADGATNSSGFNFVHNSVGYFGYVMDNFRLYTITNGFADKFLAQSCKPIRNIPIWDERN